MINKRRIKLLNKKLKLLEKLYAQKTQALANDRYNPEEASYQAAWYDAAIKQIQRSSNV